MLLLKARDQFLNMELIGCATYDKKEHSRLTGRFVAPAPIVCTSTWPRSRIPPAIAPAAALG